MSLFSEMFFPQKALLVAYSLYVIGLAVRDSGGIYYYIDLQVEKYDNILLIESPEYKTPNLRTVAIYVWDKVKDYLTKAGTTIFIASIILWFILNIGPSGLINDVSKALRRLSVTV